MRATAVIALVATVFATNDVNAQYKHHGNERFGNSLNIGIGWDNYGYDGRTKSVLHADYEFDVARNMTIAPSINFFTYRGYSRHGDPKGDSYYRQTVVPVGAKFSYYFDELLNAGKKWDFYAGVGLGFTLRHRTWEGTYYGDGNDGRGAGRLYAAGHIGTEFHINERAGIQADLSSDVSTIGVAIHF